MGFRTYAPRDTSYASRRNNGSNGMSSRTATEKQLIFLGTLHKDRQFDEGLEASFKTLCDMQEQGYRIPMDLASDLIDRAKASPWKQTEVLTAKATVEFTEGMWIIGDANDMANARIFKVQRAGSGNLYGKELVDGSFVYFQGARRLLTTEGRKLTMDEAKAYGALYGTCCICARTLTNEVSIEAGIGPVCAGRL